MKTKIIELLATHPHPQGGTIDQFESIEVQWHSISSKSVEITLLLTKRIQPIFLEIEHEDLTTLLDLTNVVPYEIWYFDAEKQFTGKAFSLHTGSGTFRVETQARFVLLWHTTTDTREKQKLTGFPCVAFIWEKDSKISSESFPFGFGIFPYLIIHHKKSPCFTQIPIRLVQEESVLPSFQGALIPLPASDLQDEDKVLDALLEHFQSVFERVNLDVEVPKKMALVLGEERAFYLSNLYGKPEESDNIPSGGIVLAPDGKMIAKHTRHFI
jgi:hypothetical protein